MSEIDLNVKINGREAELLISAMSEMVYKDVYFTIDKLKKQVEQSDAIDFFTVKLTKEQSEKALSAIIKRPFVDVFELVGKINEQLQTEKSNMMIDEERPVEFIESDDDVVEAQPHYEASQEVPQGAGFSENQMLTTIGKTLPDDLLRRLSEGSDSDNRAFA
ncbi:hypothetical protein OE749_01270 [Aestuariibacter sp. AA17]|uniref:Uncharacterized protein n=1 Tax=Fluctibacter corallii TaxID=2984329 RepID=A0ABT3A3Y0_9ALTE|nr:hypothetical protein [Aestuariibacter sp. AA17]MCV2883325.1 hypothetical protein [Aestuariibacter sp. AA17]